jgi:hypothetical protein
MLNRVLLWFFVPLPRFGEKRSGSRSVLN